jgi:hypothetical protein
MKKIFSIYLILLFVGCNSFETRREVNEKNYQAVITDMKESKFIKVGQDDNRFFAIKVVLLSPFKISEKKLEALQEKIYNANLKWMEKYQALGNFRIKYIDKEQKEIYGTGALTIASNKALLFDVVVLSNTLAGIKFYNWQVVGIPPAQFRRNFEQESIGDYPENWAAIKPAFTRYFNLYWIEVLEPLLPEDL